MTYLLITDFTRKFFVSFPITLPSLSRRSTLFHVFGLVDHLHDLCFHDAGDAVGLQDVGANRRFDESVDELRLIDGKNKVFGGKMANNKKARINNPKVPNKNVRG